MKKLLLLFAVILPMMAMAQEEKPVQGTISETDNAFLLASNLAKYGYAQNDALSLVQAARIVKTEGFAPYPQTKEPGSSTGATTSSSYNLEPARLLADAKARANGNDVILALIEDVTQMPTTRGSNSPMYCVDVVSANSYDLYRHTFRANEGATVVCNGDGDTDLDLYIYDENYNLIDKDDDYTDYCICTFNPRWTGTFYIKIVNRGRIANRYVLRSN